MNEEFPDEQIRIELKRLVEKARVEIVAKLRAHGATPTDGSMEAHRLNLSEKMNRGEAELSLRIQQMIDFIDRR